MSSVVESISLFYKDGSSDKFYTASIEERNGAYAVPFSYGRRGTSGQSSLKIENVSLDAAKKIYTKLVNEKIGKGYKPDGTTVAYAGVTADKKSTGFIPQLPNPITEEEVESYFKDSRFGSQEKHDGKHIILIYNNGITKASNKKGFECGYPVEFEKAMKEMASFNNFNSIILDGEAIGSIYCVYDILAINTNSCTGMSYAERYDKLSTLNFPDGFKLSKLAYTEKEKREMCDRLYKSRKEGLVFKKLGASYTPGRPSTLGDMIKYKFYATLSTIVVEGRSGKRAVGMELIDDSGNRIHVGNVTIPPNKDVPKIGSVIEVRYLYCLQGGSLYQPTYLGVRDDIDIEECLMSQIKYKGTEED
jgi:bifunctional non-homologous end joining protein LigD